MRPRPALLALPAVLFFSLAATFPSHGITSRASANQGQDPRANGGQRRTAPDSQNTIAGEKGAPEILPLAQIQPGMKGVAYTIYSGDKVEQIGVTVIGVLANVIAPKKSIILIKMEGPLAAESGVVAGMSGSPVYIDGKLAGAVALKLGVFTKEAIAGVRPIEQMLEIENKPVRAPGEALSAAGADEISPEKRQKRQSGDWRSQEEPQAGSPAGISTGGVMSGAAAFPVTAGLPAGASLVPIDLPLVAAGLSPEAFARFSGQLAEFGFVGTSAGGTAKAGPDDADLQPGDMAGVALISGDLSLSAGCTVTAVTGNSVLLCGHQLLGSGDVSLPMVRAHVLTTLNSAMESTKIMTVGGAIGTLTEDRAAGIMGTLGPAPATVPMSLEISGQGQTHTYHFRVAEQAKLTPVLLGLATYNTLVSDTAYNEDMTLRLEGSIQIDGHPAAAIHNVFSPTDTPLPDGFQLASDIQTEFGLIFNNTIEKIKVKDLSLRVTVVPELRSAKIENAWSEKDEVHPGETISIKTLLRPYRGAPFIREIPLTVPAEATPGVLRVLVSDAGALNQAGQFFVNAGQGALTDLDDLIHVLNSERANDRLYVTLLQATPTLVVDGTELPGAPPSLMQIIPGQKQGNTVVVNESRLGEWSVNAGQVVTGQQSLAITVQ
jgi:hypothetical protein